MNLNKVFLLGRLTADPQLRTTANGNQVATFSVATNRVWNDKIAGRREEVEFHNVVVWGQQADVASRFLAKGSLVLIEGRIQTRAWQDQQGQKRKTTEIVSERLQLPPRSINPKPAGISSYQPPAANFASAPSTSASQSDLPVVEIGDSAEENPPAAGPAAEPSAEMPASTEILTEEGEIKKEDLPF